MKPKKIHRIFEASKTCGFRMLKPYPEYKDSGVEWIGEIPEGWNVEKLKFNSEINRDSLPENFDPDYEFFYLDITNVSKNGEIINTELMSFEDAPSRARRIPQNHDTIISTVRTYLKAIAYLIHIPKNFVVSTGFSVLSPNKNLFSRFLYYLVNSDLFVQTVVVYSKGIAYPAINSSDLANLPIWYPDIETQNKISSFLDKKTSEIDLTIQKDTRLIELLQEKRTALINHVVTKGLDVDAKMKDSGVEWIGEIPEGWEVNKIKNTSYVKGRIGWHGLTSEEYSDEGAYLVTGTNFNNGEIDWESCHRINWDRYKQDPYIHLKDDDLLITKDGTIGKVALVKNLPDKATLNSGIFLIRPLNQYLNKYMYWVLNSVVFERYFDYIKTGATIAHLYQETFERFFFPIPSNEEQNQITEYLHIKTQKIDQTIQKIQTNISLLQEYKKSLIHHVVTGKVNVIKED